MRTSLAAKTLLLKQTPAQVLDKVAQLGLPVEYSTKLEIARQWLIEGKTPTAREVALTLGNGMTGPTSSVTALYIALRYMAQEFEPMIDFIIACRGDVDTMGAMAGALWGIRNGAQRLRRSKLNAEQKLK